MELVVSTGVMLNSWIKNLLHCRGLKSADDRPLYAYQVTKQEYNDLQFKLSKNTNASSYFDNLLACACFCIYCSEWYRREYKKDDGWSWDPIWDSLGFRLSSSALAKIVPKGLEVFWHRPVRCYDSERRNFLGSLFSEGGLPFQMLKVSDSRFQTVFQTILRNFDKWRSYGFDSTEQVKAAIEKVHLPQAFTESTSIDLISEMASELFSLVSLYDLDEKAEPAGYLDSINPKWRDRFPLPLDDSTGTKLLSGLLSTATAERKTRKKTEDKWQCNQFIDNLSNMFYSMITLPKRVSLDLMSTPPSTRFELFIFEGGENVLPIGPVYASTEGRIATFRPRKRDIKLPRNNVNSELALIAISGGVVVGEHPINNSTLALGDVPVGFSINDDEWECCGQASFSTASERVLVICPDHSEYKNDGLDITETSFLDQFKTLIIEGKGVCDLTLPDDADVFSLKIGRKASHANAIKLCGKTFNWSTNPKLTFIGVPKPIVTDIEMANEENNLHLVLGGKRLDTCQLQEQFGTQFFSIKNSKNETILRRKIGVLPPDFKVELGYDDVEKFGYIRIYTSHRCVYNILSDELNVERKNGKRFIQYNLRCKQVPPAVFTLSVLPNLTGDRITIEIPFPSRGCICLDGNGKVLPRHFSLDKLLGSRAYLLPSDRSIEYEIEFSLQGNHHARFAWTYQVNTDPVEVDLYSLKDYITKLVSLKPGLDQVINVLIKGPYGEDNYRILMNDNIIRFCDHDNTVLELIGSKEGVPVDAQPIGVLLHEPERVSVDLTSRRSQGVSTGLFDIPSEMQKNGPWLVVPSSKSKNVFRPFFYQGCPPVANRLTEIKTIQKAALLFDRDAPKSTFEDVLAQMSIDPDHSGWKYFQKIYDDYSYLPLATFESWRAIAKHPAALVMCLFKFEMDVNLIFKLENEFPIVWELIPLSHFKNACRNISEQFIEYGFSKQKTEAYLSKRLSILGDIIPIFDEGLQNFILNNSDSAERSFPLSIMKPIFRDWYNQLLISKNNSEWPDYGGRKIKEWYTENSFSIFDFEPEYFRNSVAYFPVFAAAVASEYCSINDLFDNNYSAAFFLRQIKEFDPKWFAPIYHYCIIQYFNNL